MIRSSLNITLIGILFCTTAFAKVIVVRYPSGTGVPVLLASGSYTPGNCLETDSNGNIVDTGSPCGGGGGSGTVTSVTFTGDGTVLSSTPSSAVTTTGTLTAALNTQNKNKVLAGPSSGSDANPTFRLLVGADLPNPSATTLGGVESLAPTTSQWINTISTSGVPSSTQPAFTDISGSVAASQLPNPSSSTLGGVRSITAVSHNFLTSISTSGIPAQAQPVFSDIGSTPTTFSGYGISDTAANLATAIGAGGTTGTTSTNIVFSTAPTLSNPVVGTQAASDNSTKAASTAYVTGAISTAVSGINPAVAVQAATTSAANTSGLSYLNGVGGIGATFTGSVNTAVTIDGYTFNALNQRLLVKNDTQTTGGASAGAFNGIYYLSTLQGVAAAPIFTRVLDYDQPSDINNTGAIPVINGTVNASTSWVNTAQVTTVGTDALVFAQFSVNPSTIVTTTRNINTSAPITGGGDLSSDRTIAIAAATSSVNGYETSNQTLCAVGITIDGGGSAITTGVKGYVSCPFAGTIQSATIQGDQSGSIVIDVWKRTFSASTLPAVGNTITASALPTISSAVASTDSTLTGWTTSVSAGDVFGFNVNSCTTITRATLILKITKT